MIHYKFIATFQILESNSVRYVEIPIRVEIPRSEMPDYIGDYYVALYKAWNEAQTLRGPLKILTGIKYIEE